MYVCTYMAYNPYHHPSPSQKVIGVQALACLEEPPHTCAPPFFQRGPMGWQGGDGFHGRRVTVAHPAPSFRKGDSTGVRVALTGLAWIPLPVPNS